LDKKNFYDFVHTKYLPSIRNEKSQLEYNNIKKEVGFIISKLDFIKNKINFINNYNIPK
jgi:hypothetical protein